MSDPVPIIAPQPATVEQAPMMMLIKARQFDQAIKNLQAQQQSLLHGFCFGRGVNLATHSVNLDTEAGTITISPINSEPQT